jgi:SEA/GATOR complex protein SEA2/WDR24
VVLQVRLLCTRGPKPTEIHLFDETDIEFRDSHALWAQHTSGTFAQLDLRNSYRPLDAVPRLAASWAVSDSLAFVTDKKISWEIPYDDM